jgi:hypothetical protein
MKNARSWLKRQKGQKPPDPGFTFVDWAGKEQPLKSPSLLTDSDALDKEKDAEKLYALFNPYLYQSGWKGDVAQVSGNGDRLRYLTNGGEAVLDRIKPAMTEGGLPIVKKYQFPGEGGAQVRVVVTKGNDKKPIGEGPHRLEVLKAGQKEAKVLANDMNAVLIPSPNRKLLAARVFPKGGAGPEVSSVIVVNDRGEVVARVALDK